MLLNHFSKTILMLSMLGNISADNILKYFLNFFQKIGFGISCIMSSLKTFGMKCQSLFSSPVHKVLMVSYCGQSMSVVCSAASTIALKAYSAYTPGPIDSILGRKHRGLVDKKKLKSFWSEIQDGHHGSHLENLFFASSPEPKGQLTPNMLGSIGVTCRSKIAKIVPIGNPSWPPLWPSWKSIFRFFSWTKRPIDSKLARKHWGDL